MPSTYNCWPQSAVFLFCLLIGLPMVSGQVLVTDEFDGAALVDQEIWRLPFPGDGAFLGRTELRSDLANDYPSVANGTVRLQLDTFRNNGAGQSTGLILGSELQTKRNFALVGGVSLDMRCRLVNPGPGLIGGVFFFDVQRTDAGGNLVRDEIDFELLSNSFNDITTNLYNEDTFFGQDAVGNPLTLSPGPAFDVTEFQDYRIDWFPDRIEWFVNEQLVRVETQDVSDDPMNFHLNLWAPNAGFAEAFSPLLQPANNANENLNFEFEIDRVQISQLNTERSSNLLLNSSFEDTTFPFINLNAGGNPDMTATGVWFGFNNVNFSGTQANSGTRSAVMFGPFTGGSDASGIFQNIDVTPGETLEASVFCRTNTGDSISGRQNFTTVRIEFLNQAGEIIPGFGQFLGDNGKESVILEGRDPDVLEDQWVKRHVAAVVPSGAVQARTSLLFVQLANESGAAFFDDFELVRLTPQAVLLGDVNLDGVVDLLDVAPFVDLLLNSGSQPEADINGDGVVDLLDVAPFVDLLLGG